MSYISPVDDEVLTVELDLKLIVSMLEYLRSMGLEHLQEGHAKFSPLGRLA